ncbi:MAG TPA: flippase activity-associated protein Agl23 [Vicinamibacterales bacterium]|nr:flippase activity-associated protein Agl23 [Vicinamibacterales bacterium]
MKRTWWTGVIYIAALALLLRFYDLPRKPLHHDEGVNTLFLSELVRAPQAYKYDPGNYHGPTLFYFGWLSVSLFGMTTEAIRIVTACAGLGLVLMVSLLKREAGIVAALTAAALLAVSAGAVYFSRYFIHEMLLVCFTFGVVLCSILWWTRGRSVFLYLAAASAGLMFATKETAIISGVVLTAAALGSVVVIDTASMLRGDDRSRVLSRVTEVLAAQSRSFARSLAERGGIRAIAVALVIFVAVDLAFYTSFFVHWQGALDALRTFAIWTKTGTSAHTHPWYTYLRWLSAEELALLVIGGIGAAAAIWRADDRLAVFAALWSIGILAAYSLIPYKTPWLTLNIIVPFALCAGYALQLLWVHARVPRAACWAVLFAALGHGVYKAAVLNFREYDNERSPYVYAHTSREVLQLVRAVEQVEADNPRTAIAVTSRDQFPLSWYLRAFPVAYYGRTIDTHTPLVIASIDQQDVLDARLGSQFERLGPYRLRPGVRLLLYVQRDLRRPSKPSS